MSTPKIEFIKSVPFVFKFVFKNFFPNNNDAQIKIVKKILEISVRLKIIKVKLENIAIIEQNPISLKKLIRGGTPRLKNNTKKNNILNVLHVNSSDLLEEELRDCVFS